jgi:hypothetical protein
MQATDRQRRQGFIASVPDRRRHRSLHPGPPRGRNLRDPIRVHPDPDRRTRTSSSSASAVGCKTWSRRYETLIPSVTGGVVK